MILLHDGTATLPAAEPQCDVHMPAFVYVLGCLTGNGPLTYVGWTHDVGRRLAQHNAGKGARFTRGRVWVLLHCEACASRRHAMSREWHLKRDRALRKKLALKLP